MVKYVAYSPEDDYREFSVKIKRLFFDSKPPKRNNPNDVGADIFAHVASSWAVYPGKSAIIPTGISLHPPDGYWIDIREKSSSSYVIIGGVVDPDYPGELFVKIYNSSEMVLRINPGQAIAQIVILPLLIPEFIDDSFSVSRNTDGGIEDQFDKDGWRGEEID